MRIDKADPGPAKRILTAMVTSDAVAGRIAAHWVSEGLFAGKWENIVGGWACKYFKKYGRAIGKEIQSRFAVWAVDAKDNSTVELVESFLGGLSDEYERNGDDNPDHIVDLAATYFNRQKMVRLTDLIRSDIADGADVRAAERLQKFSRIELGVGAGIDVIQDDEALKAAFADAGEDLVTYDEGLKYFFRGVLTRDALVAFQASEKKGKSFWLQDLAWRAMLQKRRVAYFECGDNSQNQIMRRFAVRAAARPLRRTRKADPLLYPTYLEREPNSRKCSVTHRRGHFRDPLDYDRAKIAMDKLSGGVGDGTPYLRLSCHPTATIGVPGIVGVLEAWDRLGWTPDIICIDYADLLAPISQQDRIHQIEETWAALRALSQSRHCLVVTATQANAAALRAETIDATHFSGNKKKMAYVTAFIGISQTGAEKRMGVCRLNYFQRREGDFDTEKCCYVAGCLAIANPAIKSIF
jgi:hypothetical protein